MTAKTYTRDSLERALIHHQADYSPPESGGRSTWLIDTGTGRLEMRSNEVHAYVVGLADARRRFEHPRPAFAGYAAGHTAIIFSERKGSMGSCSCGWMGEPHSDAYTAGTDAFAHISQVSAMAQSSAP